MSTYARMINETTLKIERILPGPIARVWAFLVDPEKRQTWFCGGTFDLSPGGRMHFHFDHRRLSASSPPPGFEANAGPVEMTGTIVAVEPPTLLEFDWPDPNGAASRVRIELKEEGDQVRLTLTHAAISSQDALTETTSGWHGHLDCLDAVMKGNEVPDFWSAFANLLPVYKDRLARP